MSLISNQPLPLPLPSSLPDDLQKSKRTPAFEEAFWPIPVSYPFSALSEKAKRLRKRQEKAQAEQAAADTYQSRKEAGEKVSYAGVAAEFGVNECMLRRRVLSIGRSVSEFTASKQKLTHAEEEVLVMSILEASKHGFPPTHHQIAREANRIQSARLGDSYQPVGKQWVNQFL